MLFCVCIVHIGILWVWFCFVCVFCTLESCGFDVVLCVRCTHSHKTTSKPQDSNVQNTHTKQNQTHKIPMCTMHTQNNIKPTRFHCVQYTHKTTSKPQASNLYNAHTKQHQTHKMPMCTLHTQNNIKTTRFHCVQYTHKTTSKPQVVHIRILWF